MDLIVGGGKYGCHAIEYLRQQKKQFLVVDTDPNCLAVKRFKLKTFEHLISEGFVNGGLPKVLELIVELKPEYVFPTALSDIRGAILSLFILRQLSYYLLQADQLRLRI